MYLHLGSDVVVSSRDIVAILDLEKTSVSKITREFLAEVQNEQKVITVSREMPKSYVITQHGEEEKVYISPISSTTLLKRADIFNKKGGLLGNDIG